MVEALGQVALLGGLGLAAGVTAMVLALQEPPVTGATVLAAAPWMVVGGLLAALSAAGAYGTLALFDPPQVHLTALLLGGVVWAPLVHGGVMRDRRAATPRYLAAAGLGAALVLAAVLFWRATPSAAGVVVLVSAPITAVLLAAGGYLLLGLVDATPLAHTRFAGLLAVFAHALAGVATTIAVDVFGRSPGWLAAFVADAAGALPVAGVGWLLVPLRVAVALVAVLVLGRYVREAATRAFLALAAVVAVGLGPGVATLLAVAVG